MGFFFYSNSNSVWNTVGVSFLLPQEQTRVVVAE